MARHTRTVWGNDPWWGSYLFVKLPNAIQLSELLKIGATQISYVSSVHFEIMLVILLGNDTVYQRLPSK